jgi:hypothetical protein
MSSPNRHNGGPPIDDELTLSDKEGWVRISRRIRSHWLVGFGRTVTPMEDGRGAYSRAEAWIDLVMECAYDGRTVNNNGRRMEIKPGQILGAVSWLSRRWNWTPKTVRGFLDALEDDGMITVENPWIDQQTNEVETGFKAGRNKGKLANVLTVCKYSIYQLAHRNEGQVERQVQGESGAGSGPVKGDIYKEEQSNNKQASEPVAEAISGLNGIASAMLANVEKWMVGGDAVSAQRWLAGTVKNYGHDITKDSFHKLETELATGAVIANPLRTWSSIATRMRDERARQPQSAKTSDMRALEKLIGGRQ